MKNVFKVFGVTLAGVLMTGCATMSDGVRQKIDGIVVYGYVHHVNSGGELHLNLMQSGGDFVNGQATPPGNIQPNSGDIVEIRLTKNWPKSDFVGIADKSDCDWVGGHGGFSDGGVVCKSGWTWKRDLPFSSVSVITGVK